MGQREGPGRYSVKGAFYIIYYTLSVCAAVGVCVCGGGERRDDNV